MSRPFWVIFDTCQYPPYYGDVHNLLALPEGVVLRYDYKKQYLSESGIQLASRNVKAPVLLLYAQKATKYERDMQRSSIPEGDWETSYIATRLATMVNVASDSERYFFDFALGAYPIQDAPELRLVLEDLETRGEVPWKKWVTATSAVEDISSLANPDQDQGWVAAVELFTRSPIQFRNDAFWRIDGPYSVPSDDLRRPHVETVGGRTKARQSRATYRIVENSTWRFELISESGKLREEVGQARGQYLVRGRSSNPDKLSFAGDATFHLRHYTRQQVDIRAHEAALFGRTLAELVLSTEPKETSWPSGPDLRLRFRVMRSKLRLAIGVVLGVLGTIVYGVGEGGILEDQPLVATLLKVGGTLLVVGAGLALAGKLKFKA